MIKASSIEGDFPFPPGGREGEREGITPDRNKRMFRRKIGDERAYLVLNLCSTRCILLHGSTIVKSF
jgi:hypothetical protein